VPSEAVATGGGERVDEAGSGVVVFDAGGGACVCELRPVAVEARSVGVQRMAGH